MKGVALAVGVMAIMAIVGYLAISSSTYMTVGELWRLERPAVVTVRGHVADTLLIPEQDLVVFVLTDGNGTFLRATYGLSDFISQYGAPPSHATVEGVVVFKGEFVPLHRGQLVGEMKIQQILQGCHRAYEAPPATGG